jgi:UDP:flavonoid glycosyltransferase YjiC (YdhE family)
LLKRRLARVAFFVSACVQTAKEESMKNIFFAWELGLNYGHLASIVPPARALRALGHKCSIAAQNVYTAFQTKAPPFDMILPAPLSRKRRISAPTLTYPQAIIDGGFDDVDELTALTRSWCALFDLVKPDLVVCEHAPAALLAAAITQRPAAMIGSSFMVPPRAVPMPAMMPIEMWVGAQDIAARAAADASVETILNGVCDRMGAPRFENFAALLATADEYVKTWPELDHYGPQAGRHYYGPMLGFDAAVRITWPQGNGARIFAYLPADVRDRNVMIEALRLLGHPTVLHGGSTPPDLPAHIYFSAAPVDMNQMGSEADLIINHAGHGTVAAALRCGKPQLLLPSTFERNILAYRAVRAGIACVPLQADPTPAGLADLVSSTLSSGALAKSTALIAKRYTNYNPEVAAQELAEDLIEQIS